MKQDFRYKTQRGHQISITRYGDTPYGQRPCVLYVHGFKGFKDWGFVPYLGKSFHEAGIDLVTFNFSHNGIGADGQSFTDLEGFSKNTFSLEKEETLEMIRLCAFSDFFGGHLLKPLGIMGHSRGGGIATLAAAESQEVKALCTWSAVSTFERYPKPVVDAWRKKGYTEVKNTRTGQTFRLGTELLRDLEMNARRKLNVLEAARKLEKPFLIIHGQNDETVPYFEAEQLNVFGPPHSTELRLIPNGSHTLGASHPFDWQAIPEPLSLATETTIAFFLQHLAS
ncbi:MAG: alpha/beta hydrolase [Bacteroidia bacterium]|nr:alpha/beta hydrolase [Bacteroidia bacterium]